MSSRQEEKARLRAEREAKEQAAARAQSRKDRLRLVLGAVVALAAIVVAVLVFSSREDDGGTNASSPGGAADVKLPPFETRDLTAAAKAADCTVKTSPAEGRDHESDPAKWVYKTNPPTSGTHDPVAAEDGLYEVGNAPTKGATVHALEHGRIDIQYKKGSPKAVIDQLETVGSEKLSFGTEGYHVLVFENNTEMEPAVAATAWTQSLTCPTMNDSVYDAVRAFRTEYTDKGPELIP